MTKEHIQILVNPDGTQTASIITRFGLFEFLSMPLGLRNPGQSFQRFIDEVRDLDICFVHVAGIQIFSKNETKHPNTIVNFFADSFFMNRLSTFRRSHSALPLRDNQLITWTPALGQAFETCKGDLSQVTLLFHRATNVPLGLFTDASNVSVDAFRMQLIDRHCQPFSKKLSTRKTDKLTN